MTVEGGEEETRKEGVAEDCLTRWNKPLLCAQSLNSGYPFQKRVVEAHWHVVPLHRLPK